MDKFLDPHRVYAVAFIDNVTIHFGMFYKHLKHMDTVLMAMSEVSLILRVEKIQFVVCSNIVNLGHNMGCRKHQPEDKKVEAVLKMNKPEMKKQLQFCLGLFNCQRAYVPSYSDIALLLTALTKAKMPYKQLVGPEQQ